MDVHIHNSRPVHYGRNDRAEDDLQSLTLAERECIKFFEEVIGALEEEEEDNNRSGSSVAEPRPASVASAAVDPDIIDLVHPPANPQITHTDVLPVTPVVQEPVTRPETVEVKANREPLPVIPPPVTQPPQIPAPVIPPPVIQSPVIPPPVIQSPVIPPSVIQSPVIPPPVIQSPVIPPSVIQSPVIPPPVIQSPVIQSPVIQSPVIPPPVIQSPVIQSPVIQSPVIQSPVIPPPVIQSPVIQSPVIKSPVIPPPVIQSPVIPPPVIKSPVILPPVIQSPVTPPPLIQLPLIPPPVIPPFSDPEPELIGHPGLAPPPAVILSKSVENQSSLSGSQPPLRRRSLETPHQPKHGPPTHAKPTHLPEKISLLLGSREHIPHSIATEAVSVQERRAQMLTNITGPAHPLDGGEPACVRNLPMRSMSFRDPTLDKSRTEALSKLGLAQRRTQSVINKEQRKEPGKSITKSNSNSEDTVDHPKSGGVPVLRSAEITHSDFNSYGGKSITLNPMPTFRAEYVSTSIPEKETLEIKSGEPNFRSRSYTFTPDTSGSRRISNEDFPRRMSDARVHPPTPAPRPFRPGGSRPTTLSPELRRKTLPKQSFRTQGITVQFSGKGTTDEARRDALRKLGLLKDTS